MSRRRGFTLLEMLVATALMGVAVAGLLAALSASLRNAARLTDHDRAALVARRKVEELLLDPRLARFQPVEGVLTPADGSGLRGGWRARLTPFETPPNPAPGQSILERLECEIWWMEGSRRRSYRLEAYRTAVLRTEDVQAGAIQP